MTTVLEVSRVVDGELVWVGTIRREGRGTEETFVYADSYLERADASPISLSLPLTTVEFPARQMRPYFEGLLPEGATRQALVGALGVPADAQRACGGGRTWGLRNRDASLFSR